MRVIIRIPISLSAVGSLIATALAADPWADSVVRYDAGSTPIPGYTDASVSVGTPERFTGEGFGFPSVVSPFNPAFGTDEIVSIGEGGSLVVGFDEPIRNAATNRFGVDFIVFGNGGFVDADFPNGLTTDDALIFGDDPYMRISVSRDGIDFIDLGDFTEGFFPAMGYLDGGAFDDHPGSIESDFTTPVDPSLTRADFAAKTLADIRAAYDGSGGGKGIDIAATGLDEISFVRIDVLDDGDSATELNVEVDGFSTVPEPATLLLIGLALSCAHRRG